MKNVKYTVTSERLVMSVGSDLTLGREFHFLDAK